MMDTLLLNTMLYVGGSSGRGFRVLSRHISALNPTGLIIFWSLLAVVVIFALTASRWYPRLVSASAHKERKNLVWVAAPKIGGALVLTIFFAVLPIFSLFSSRSDSWWVLLFFGWAMAAVVLYMIFGLRHMNDAVMVAGDRYYISAYGGLGGWKPVDRLHRLGVHTEHHFGAVTYVLTGVDDAGETQIAGRFALTNFPQEDYDLLLSFIKTYQTPETSGFEK